MLTTVFQTFLEISIIAGLLTLLVFMLRKLTRGRYPPQWFCVVYTILAIRMLIPWNFTLPKPPVELSVPDIPFAITESQLPATTNPSQVFTQFLTDSQRTERQEQTFSATAPKIGEVLASVWIVGMSVLLIVEFVSFCAGKRRFRRWSFPESDLNVLSLLTSVSKDICPKHAVALYRSEKISSPMVMGIFKPVLFLPDICYSEKELRLILRHEMEHIQRLDLLYKWLWMIARTVHWFNPAAWIMEREANQLLELSCDQRTITGLGMDERYHYCSVILDTASGRFNHFSTFLGGSKKMLKERFDNILHTSPCKTGILALTMALLYIITGSSFIKFGFEPPLNKAIVPVTDTKLTSVTLSESEKQTILSEIHQVVEFCQSAYKEITASYDKEKITSPEFAQAMIEKVAQTGITIHGYTNFQTLYNYEKFLSFYQDASTEKDAQLTIFKIDSHRNLYLESFISRKEKVYLVRGTGRYLVGVDDFSIGKAYEIESMDLTDAGHFIFHVRGRVSTVKKYADESPGTIENTYDGFCAIPHNDVLMELCRKYINPISTSKQTGILTTNWDSKHLSDINWEAAFGCAYKVKYNMNMWDVYPTIANPTEADPDGKMLVVSAKVVEQVLQEYYPVTVDELRNSEFFSPEQNSYIWRNPYGFSITDWMEVADFTKNLDGSVSMTVRCVTLPLGTDQFFTSKLTIKVRDDGTYQYLSNRLIS